MVLRGTLPCESCRHPLGGGVPCVCLPHRCPLFSDGPGTWPGHGQDTGQQLYSDGCVELLARVITYTGVRADYWFILATASIEGAAHEQTRVRGCTMEGAAQHGSPKRPTGLGNRPRVLHNPNIATIYA